MIQINQHNMFEIFEAARSKNNCTELSLIGALSWAGMEQELLQQLADTYVMEGPVIDYSKIDYSYREALDNTDNWKRLYDLPAFMTAKDAKRMTPPSRELCEMAVLLGIETDHIDTESPLKIEAPAYCGPANDGWYTFQTFSSYSIVFSIRRAAGDNNFDFLCEGEVTTFNLDQVRDDVAPFLGQTA